MPASYSVFRVPKKEARRLESCLGDDRLSRESLHVYEARHFGIEGDDFYVILEASPEGTIRGEAILLDFAQRAPDAEAIYTAWLREEERAAESLGKLFGDS